jgi:TP901 family phage tail tape measure protein
LAETVSIECSVSVKDKTQAGTQSAERNLRRLSQIENGSHNIEVGVEDNATDRISSIESQAEQLSGVEPDIEVGASDTATPVLDDVSDKAETLNGTESDVEVGADDEATPIMDEVVSQLLDDLKDQASELAGSTSSATSGITAAAPLAMFTGKLKSLLLLSGSVLGISAGFSDTISTFESFEAGMSQVEAISGATGSELEALTAKAKEMGETTKFTATESAEAFNYMAMAGWKTEDMLSGISGVMNLSAASGESLGSTSDIVTDALTAFGLSASDSTHFADVLAQASANANTNVGLLGESFKYVAPVAGAMNYSIEDTSLALGLMASASIKGSMAGTSLKTALSRLVSPTNAVETAMEKYKISMTDSEGNAKSLGEVIENLRESLGGLSETEQTAAVSKLFGKYSMSGMLSIINATEDDYNKLLEAVYNADGASEQMAETMLDNLEGSITLMQSKIEGVQNSFGERLSPYIKSIAEAVTDAMPGTEAALTQLMDFVDGKADGIKRTIDRMKDSAQWEDADLFGKLDIAWDEIIADPFKKLASTKGKNLLTQGLGTLFSEAAKIMPGGEEAGLSSWLSAWLITKGTTSLIGSSGSIVKALTPIGTAIKDIGLAAKTAPTVGAFISDLGGMIPTAGKVAIAAAAIAASVAAISVAVNNYNQTKISSSLEEHFGNITLSAKEAEDAASRILNAEYLVNVELAMGEIENADEMRKEAQTALEENEKLAWKTSIGISLTDDEKESYTENTDTFINSIISELESRAYAAYISTETFLGGTEQGTALADAIESWARADEIELQGLSADLQSAVEDALTAGVDAVDEWKMVSELQEKMNSITSRWKQAESDAQMDWIELEYGNLSAKQLESGSFVELIDALSEQRQAGYEETADLAKEFYAVIEAADAAGRLGPENGVVTAEEYKNMVAQVVRNQEAEDLQTSVDFETNTLSDAYAEKISSNIEKTQTAIAKSIETANQNAEDGVSMELLDTLSAGASIASSGTGRIGIGKASVVTDADQSALNELWESMKPDADAMASLIDEYVKAGEEIPSQLKASFNEAMETGAASGDTDAAWQVYANSLFESGDQALVDAINQMDAAGTLPEELSAAWKRAIQPVTDSTLTFDGLQATIEDIDISADSTLTQEVEKALKEAGAGDTEVDVDGTELKLTLGEVTVDDGDALEKVADAVGMTVEQIIEYNELSDDAEVEAGLTISIPSSRVKVGTDDAKTAADTAVEQAFSESFETTGSANIFFQQTNNAESVYSETGSQLRGIFNTPFAVKADVETTLDWSIVNPTKSIRFTSSDSGGIASINASFHAAGGKVGKNGAELSWVGEEGPEYIIPTVPGRRSRGISLWEQAGQALGVLDRNGQISAHADGGIVGVAGTAIPLVSESDGEEEESIWSVTGSQTRPGTGKDSSNGNNIEINIDLNPVIQIEGDDMDEQEIFEVVLSRCREMADELSDEIAERMAKVFANSPIVQEG